MENEQYEQHKETSQVADMTVLSGRAHEYVVNFRNKFLTYFALPLFLLFIALALGISWIVFVPARSEHPIMLSKARLELPGNTKRYLESKAEKIRSAHINYDRDDGSTIQLECSVSNNGKLSLTELPGNLQAGSSIEATLVIFADEDRFLFKLVDELAKNLKLRKPPADTKNP